VEGRTQFSAGGSPSAPIRFGSFELDVRAGELRNDGRRVRLQDQSFQILRMLLECPGDVVLREEIRNQLWPSDTVVEFDHSINTAVMRLRDALGESAGQPHYIETLARRGYRFIGQVEAPANQPLSAAPLVIVPRDSRPRPPLLRPRILIPILLGTLFLLGLAGAWYYRRGAPARWAREVALPEATRLVSAKNDTADAAAFALLYRALKILPQDPALNRILHQISHPVPVRTTPPGASVYIKPYRSPDAEWIFIGQSPLEHFLLPEALFRWRITKPGFRTVEAGVGVQGPGINFALDPEGSIPAEMVHVPGGGPLHLDDFWMDRYEVTNKEFKSFVDKGGYQNRQYWRQEFVKNGRVLSWRQAMHEFRDATGRPGPLSWEAGAYPQGHDDFPVNGVSWYEAAVYAEFAKKQLPTVYHWDQAASQNSIYSDILQFSNFDGGGPVRVGSRQGIGAFGTYDMAGNVKEWCWNAVGTRRYILGGGWSESRAFYIRRDALSPFDRSPANGFRCVRYPGGAILGELTRPVDDPRDYRTQKPVSDSAFRILQSVYSYDRTELKAVTESTDESSPYWRVERITFDAAYDHQRVIAWLYLPRNAKPPYQTIIFFPAGHSRVVASIDEAEIRRMDFLITGGRAVLFPEYQGTFGRRPQNPPDPSGLRDQMIQQCKDLQRSVDYLETRPDIAHDQLGFFGISQGSKTGILALALERRIRAAAIAEAGLWFATPAPEVDEINFAPRIRIPLLMMSGRDDFAYPVETSQVPLFRLLGTPEKDKRHVLFESGHRGPTHEYIKETLDWFDRYLGPVSR
jgi:DNA-binding winged helix-turn-helix (wHTH) protein/formylglycine-generating enzyme required for sulfatase activity